MSLFDQHVHSWHSFDSDTDPEDNVRRALELGLGGLTFTEHFDTHADDWPECRYDEEAYTATIRRLRDAYGTRLFIGKGIEVCYQPDRMDFILDFLARHRFDMVILSVHYFKGNAVHVRERWAGITPEEGTRQYLENVLQAARFCERLRQNQGRVFDVLGHLDLAKRYTQRFFGSWDVATHGDLIDEILQVCLAADLVPEINTSSLRQNLDETLPGQRTVTRYAQLGGRAMSIGSDAHLAASVGAGFDRALTLLREAHVSYTAVFQGKERLDVPVPP
jgi:histidinol-phosphatase (PHP family)